MLFALGYIAGLITATLVVMTLVFFREKVERHVEIIERVVEQAGPRVKGFVFEPKDEAEETRDAIIEGNRQMGRDTPISELR